MTNAQIRRFYKPTCPESFAEYRGAENLFAMAEQWAARDEPWALANVRTYQRLACIRLDAASALETARRLAA